METSGGFLNERMEKWRKKIGQNWVAPCYCVENLIAAQLQWPNLPPSWTLLWPLPVSSEIGKRRTGRRSNAFRVEPKKGFSGASRKPLVFKLRKSPQALNSYPPWEFGIGISCSIISFHPLVTWNILKSFEVHTWNFLNSAQLRLRHRGRHRGTRRHCRPGHCRGRPRGRRGAGAAARARRGVGLGQQGGLVPKEPTGSGILGKKMG